MGLSCSYQCRTQRQTLNVKAAAAATKKAVCKHRSLSTLPRPGACAACHCQGPMMQGQFFWENTWHASGCCNVLLGSATAGSPCLPYPSLPPSWVSQIPLISCYFNTVLSEQRTDALRRPTRRSGTKSKAEPKELCKQRREREISSSSLRSSGLNLHNQLDVPCISGVPGKKTNHPKSESVNFGSYCRLGVCSLPLICFWF